jgi:FtsH-binding integral membrane protein
MTTAMVMSFVLIFALMVKKDEHPTNMYLLTAFTLVEAYTIGVICATFSANGNGDLILQAAGLTALVFCSLTAYTFTSKTDFSFMGAGLVHIVTTIPLLFPHFPLCSTPAST